MTESPAHPATNARPRKHRLALWCAVVYAAALVASHVWQATRPEAVPPHPEQMVEIDAGVDSPTQPTRVAFGDVAGFPLPSQRLYIHRWGSPVSGIDEPRNIPEHTVPVILLHGAPGDGAGFDPLSQRLMTDARGTRPILAPDLPGFGFSPQPPLSASVRANAHVLAGLLDHEHIQRAHIVGWSNGGGTAIHFAQIYPDRVASLTLMAAIGPQEFEGSGNHAIEHAKYATGFVLLGALPEAVPHFGALGTYASRTGWLRNFAETDQRLLTPAMTDIGRNGTPTLVLHGQGDILVPIESAYATHERIASSRMIVLDANHFLPFMQAGETAGILEAFFEEHDAPAQASAPMPPGLRPPPDVRAPPPGARERAAAHVRGWGWPVHSLILVAAAALCPPFATVLAGLLVGHQATDMFVAACAVLLGGAARTAALSLAARRAAAGKSLEWTQRLVRAAGAHGWRSALVPGWDVPSLRGAAAADVGPAAKSRFFVCRGAAVLLRAFAALPVCVILIAVCEVTLVPRVGGVTGLVIEAALCLCVHRAFALLTRRGWQHARISVQRAMHHEFWPAWLFYIPLVPYAWWLGVRAGGFLVGGASNPAIDHAGGWVGESKEKIMRALGPSPFALPTVFIPAGRAPADRAGYAAEQLRARSISLPVILKPDSGQRGFAVKLARTDNDVRAYFERVTTPVVAQPYHPGPCECGIFWVRRVPPAHGGGADAQGGTGSIFSITRKEFPVIVGDGVRTLEELVFAHPRYRLQHAVFLARFAHESQRVLHDGERLRLSMSGNHCQGTLFRDGADLITPELSRVVDGLCAGFGAPVGVPAGLDFCRLDVRYESDDLLRQGRGFAVVEVNGSSAESTNLYDPSRGLLWSYGVLFAQWERLYAIGAWRKEHGGHAPTWREWRAMMREHYATRTGDALAD